MKQFFVTLDIGTSKIKGMIWDTHSNCHYTYSVDSPRLQINDFFVEQDRNEFIKKIILVLKKLNTVLSFKKMFCLAISGQRNTMIAYDDNTTLTPVISWLDTRGHYVNGDRLDWLLHHFKNVIKIRSLISDFCELLTGVAYETASTTPQEYVSAPEKFTQIHCPHIISHGTTLNAKTLHAELRKLIPDGLDIMLGAGDKDCSLLGGLAYLSSRAVLCSGTAISLGKLVSKHKSIDTQDNFYFSPTLFSDYRPVETGLPYARNIPNILQSNAFDLFNQRCELPKPTSSLFYFPSSFKKNFNIHTQSYRIDNNQKITTNTLASAALEGIILELLACKLSLEKSSDPIREIILGGNNHWLMQHTDWLADALNCQILIPSHHELTSCGLALTVIALHQQEKDLFKSHTHFLYPMQSIQPNPLFIKHWRMRFQMYLRYKESANLTLQ